MIRKVISFGGSLGVTLDKKELKFLKIEKGDDVNIIITKVNNNSDD